MQTVSLRRYSRIYLFDCYCCCVVGSWRASNHTAFWGLTLDEGIRYRLGTFRPVSPVNKMTSLRVFAENELPEMFDSRVEWPGLIEDVLDQGNCGSSWAFSTTGQCLLQPLL